MRTAIFAALAALAFAGNAAAVELTVGYSHPWLYKEAHESIAREFAKVHPEIQLRFQAPSKTYEEATTQALRAAMTRSAPDVLFTGTNILGVLVDRELAVPLDPLIEKERNWKALGYVEKMVATGRVAGHQYGLPLALSTPVMYLNADLVRRAGGDPDHPPATWEEVFALARKVNALGGGAKGMFFHWQTTGNYLWQALLFSHDGELLKAGGRDVAFDGPAGLRTFEILSDMVRVAHMPNYTREQGRQEFTAGQIAMQFSSSAELNLVTAQIGGRFELRTAPFPAPRAGAPIVSGGATGVILAADSERQRAAFEYLKFASGPVGQSIIVKTTGYLPSNQIAIDTPSMLGEYYAQHPNARTSLVQLARATPWLGFPGENSIKIIDVLYNVIEGVMSEKLDPPTALSQATKQVRGLLPR